MSESMKDFEKELEESFKYMGDGAHSTDELLAWEKSVDLMEKKTKLKATVTGVTKGGLICAVEGMEEIRAFLPISKISLERVTDLNSYLEKELMVRVITSDMREDSLVVSAVEILREEKLKKDLNVMDSMTSGMVLKGTVKTIKDYGAFIDLENGLSGLVHISQISLERITHPAKVLAEGQEVKVKVLEVKDGKLSLSIKALLEDKREEEEAAEEGIELPESESIGTSFADLLKGIKL